jgi:hypothetical protein
MGNTSCRYIINAVGKSGESYHTHCQNKQELTKWIADNKEKLIMNELKIIDENKFSFLKWLSLKR